ncbi:Type II secretion system protein D precursor [compost metagenome]
MVSEKDLLRFLYFLVCSIFAFGFYVHSSSCSASERIELYDATLQDFVEWSSTQLNRSVVVGADIRSAPISIFATYDSPAALEKLVEEAVLSSGFHFSSLDGVIRIGSTPFKPPLDLLTEVVQLQHLQSDFAHQAVRDVLASRAAPGEGAAPSQASVTPSPTSNALIVTATRDQLDAIRKVIAEIDRPRRQVVITAVVAELTDDAFEALGLNVALDGKRASLAGVSIQPSDFASGQGFSLTFDGPTLGALLQAVRATGNNRILSTPQLLTLNREPASIVVGQNVPFVTGQTTSGSTPASDPFQTIVRQDVGVSLAVTPFITPSDAIELEVEQSASSVSDDRTAADIITNTRRIVTKVQLQDGEGVVLGGLRSEQKDKSVSAVPILSDIPWLGRLFRSESSRVRGTNLVVLLTARVHRQGDAIGVPEALREPARLMLPHLSVAPEGIGAAGDIGRRAGVAEAFPAAAVRP